MLPYFLIFILVGLPGIYGAKLDTEKIGKGDATIGGLIVLYAIILTTVITVAHPVGRFTGSNYAFKFPVVLALALAAGILIGLVRRWRK